MSEKITIEGTEYEFDKMEESAKELVRQVADLDAKMHRARFEYAQIQKARDAFFEELKINLGAS